jgi:uncharacterized RDD family membrane protein YckC
MKCPKCGYLGFETSDRCRHCGYDFSLVAEAGSDLLLRPGEETSALADFALGDLDTGDRGVVSGGLDLDRLIGSSAASEPPSPPTYDQDVEARLPLFDAGELEDTPLIQSAGPPRAPLAVRRASPEVARARTRTTRSFRQERPSLALELEPPPVSDEVPARRSVYVRPGATASSDDGDGAGGLARLTAFLLDLTLLAAINAGVVYLTLQIAGLRPEDADVLPLGPLAAFLMLLNGGYVVALTAASGQTIGKMAAGIRVVPDGAGRLDTGRAVLRAAASLLSIVTCGAGFLPALFRPGGRTFHDRIARTRVRRD